MRYGGNTACVEVRTGADALIVLDAGTGLRLLGRQLADAHDERSADAPVRLFLTHRHLDHLIGLPHFAPLFESSRTVEVVPGDNQVEETRSVIAALLTPPFFPELPEMRDRVRVSEFPTDASAVVGDAYTVHRFPARHPGGASVFRLDDTKGAGIAYAPDNELDYASTDAATIAWRRGLTQALHGVPILLHDATYTDSELPSHRGWGHSSAMEATRFAMECVAGMLVLFHHHPDRADDTVDAIVQECRQLVALNGSTLRVIAAWEGLTLTV